MFWIVEVWGWLFGILGRLNMVSKVELGLVYNWIRGVDEVGV